MPAAFANSREVVPSKPVFAKTSLTDSIIACLRSLNDSRDESFMCKPLCIGHVLRSADHARPRALRMEEHSAGSHAKSQPIGWIHHSSNFFCSLCDRLYSPGSNTFSLRASASFFPTWPASLQPRQGGAWPPPFRASAWCRASPFRLSTSARQVAAR